ncbi:hypothetical protein CDAR_418511 [Caerostris darwini]|uniref:Uncharacterized protein n=1 Tax=Caerostris darwini TaxID=1538125 RepID=A0AAV4MZ66_9ARAC|nr:hypothetical protein CDAR_418511 [Caerostris darwini]
MKDLIDGYFSGDVEALDDYVYTYPVGIMIRKNFCCRKSIDRKLRRIVETGLYFKSKNHYYFRAFLKDKKYEKERLKATQENYNSLSMVDLSGAFLLFALGTIISLATLILEIIHARLKFFAFHPA